MLRIRNSIQCVAPEYYLQADVVKLSRDLLGKYLLTKFDNQITGGKIIEAEAYRGPEDKASHAYGHRRTSRNEVMYHKGGICYVYICYGIHALFNIVTNIEGIPDAILIRAIEPEFGIETMMKRRNKNVISKTLTSGPGSLTQALGITIAHNGLHLFGPEIWLEDRGIAIPEENICAGPRIGIDYAQEDALLPWRFTLKTRLG
jgi:DNA-3-methyladenine glycosylase